ncbi:MAG: hypothetical protein HY876_05450 [Coriobacteriales bacterium]|nr:hypothetical protein [Coriobacteriales bacterium]
MEFIGGIAQLAITIFIIVYVVRSVIRLRRHVDPGQDPNWDVHAFVSLDDLLSQLLVAVGVTLGVVSLILLSRRLGIPVRADHFLLLGVMAAFALSWIMRAPALLVLGALGTYGWAARAAWQWVWPAKAGGVAVPLGIALVALSLMAAGRLLEGTGRGRRFGFFAWLFGLLGLLSFLFWASSLEGVAQLGELRQGSPFVSSVPLAILVGIELAVPAGLLAWALFRRSISLAEGVGLGAIWLVLLALAIRPPIKTAAGAGDIFFGGGTPKLTAEGMAWAVTFNVVLLAGLLGLVFLGYLRRENWLVNFSAVLLFVFVLVKYFDWLFTFLDRSVAFIVSGLLFLGVGALMERGRRYVIQAMEPDDTTATGGASSQAGAPAARPVPPAGSPGAESKGGDGDE